MDTPRRSILFGNEPRLYREAFAAAIKELRPHLEVIVVDPVNVEAALDRHPPRLLVCSRVTDAMQATDIEWIVIPHLDSEPVVARTGGVAASLREFTLDDLLDAIDRAVAEGGASRPACHGTPHAIS